MSQKGAHRISPITYTPVLRSELKPIPRDVEPRGQKKNPPPPPKPLFGGEGCCDGKSAKQIFWYVPMGNTNFGIHMNAEEFERIYDEQQSETRRVLFRNGISHEYFHHIVDTWCVINEINQGKLRKRYEKQMHAEYINNEYNGYAIEV